MTSLPEISARALVFGQGDLSSDTILPALKILGFSNIKSVSTFERLRRQVITRSPDLLFLDYSRHKSHVFSYVTDIRQGSLGDNPFMTIILTGWTCNEKLLRDALRIGANDLLIRPFSIKFVKNRVSKQVLERPSFVDSSSKTDPKYITLQPGHNHCACNGKPILSNNFLKTSTNKAEERYEIKNITPKNKAISLDKLYVRLIILIDRIIEGFHLNAITTQERHVFEELAINICNLTTRSETPDIRFLSKFLRGVIRRVKNLQPIESKIFRTLREITIRAYCSLQASASTYALVNQISKEAAILQIDVSVKTK